MAYTQTKTDADTFFGTDNHIRAYDWTNYGDDERTAAVAQAQRELQVWLARDLVDPTTGDTYRDDYACFEQALFILDNTVRTRNSETSAQRIETVDTMERDKYFGVTICPQSMRYLALPRVRITRGS